MALTLSGTLAAQTENHKPFVEVTGSSETEITPDEIYITVTLQERMEAKEKITIDKQEEDLKTNLKELGIELSNLSLNTANADYRKIKSSKKDLITSKSYILKVVNADMVEKVYKRLDKINAYDAYISKLSHTKILEYQKENRIKAVTAAKEKASYILAAVGNQLSAPISITEITNGMEDNLYGYWGRYYGGNAVQSMNNVSYNESSGPADDISIRKIKVKSSFLVKYEIK